MTKIARVKVFIDEDLMVWFLSHLDDAMAATYRDRLVPSVMWSIKGHQEGWLFESSDCPKQRILLRRDGMSPNDVSTLDRWVDLQSPVLLDIQVD